MVSPSRQIAPSTRGYPYCHPCRRGDRVSPCRFAILRHVTWHLSCEVREVGAEPRGGTPERTEFCYAPHLSNKIMLSYRKSIRAEGRAEPSCLINVLYTNSKYVSNNWGRGDSRIAVATEMSRQFPLKNPGWLKQMFPASFVKWEKEAKLTLTKRLIGSIIKC